jgi:hypothetical protein
MAGHSIGEPGAHAPFAHVPAPVHTSPSSRSVPSGAAGDEQAPVAGSHAPPWWQASTAGHATGLAPTHVPDWHSSTGVNALPSSHAVP